MNFKTVTILLSILLASTAIQNVSEFLFPKAHSASMTSLEKLPDFTTYKNIKKKKEAFFATLYPIIEEENKRVLITRGAIHELKTMPITTLNDQQTTWLLNLAQRYKLYDASIDENFFDNLLRRVDYIPPSLALSQAAIESGWGTSRFSKIGNNIFGQWCFTIGCGIVPKSRESGKTHEVAKFDTVNQAVRGYILNLNSNASFNKLRQKRASLRENNQSITGIALAKTLAKYSGEGTRYIDKLTQFINQNKLQRFNKTVGAPLSASIK